MFGDLSQCATCEYLRSWYTAGTDTAVCAAFPAGIPDPVWFNALDHREAVPGDRGIRWESNGEEFPEWALADDTGLPAGARAHTRVAGHDTHPGGEQLKHWWTKDPEGLAKWATLPEGRWTALYEHLLPHMNGNEALAKATAAKWFHDVFGYWPGDQKGKNPVGPG